MADRRNTRVLLTTRPDGMPTLDDFAVEDVPVEPVEPGHVVVAVDHLSVDAFIRASLNEGSIHTAVPIGGTVGALGVGHVVESADDSLALGDAVVGGLGAQTVATVPGAMVRKVDPVRPLPDYLGALGLTTGVTAYFGMLEVGRPEAGDTVVVSGAAGAVGTVAGQIARLAGAGEVIGIAGGPHKVAYLTDQVGYDAGIDYKGEDVNARLRELCPNGIDVFFDNVGGDILDAALDNIAQRGRVSICGAISQYNRIGDATGPSLYLRLAERYARMEGFTVMHFADRYAEAEAQLAAWMDARDLVLPEHVVDGVERFPDALLTLLTGGHIGKLLVRV